MKPAAFEYCAPRTLDAVAELLAEAPYDTSLLAGGQSLMPMMNMRLARPKVVVDLNRVEGLDAVEPLPDGGLRLGAMVRQRTLEVDPAVRERAPLVAAATRHIAHLQIRTRGTIGGSLAHADPAAELPAVMLALEARMIVIGSDGASRAVPANEFFFGALTTAIELGEVLVAIELPPFPDGAGCAFTEFARTHGAFALAGVAAVLGTGAGGGIDHARLAFCGVGPVQYEAGWAQEALAGQEPSPALFAGVGERVREEAVGLLGSHTDRDYRSRLVGHLAERALTEAAARGEESS